MGLLRDFLPYHGVHPDDSPNIFDPFEVYLKNHGTCLRLR